MRDLQNQVTSVEIILRSLFKRIESSQQLLTFGGIFMKEGILDECGFYNAIISTLTQYYDYENSSRIDEFIMNIEDIKKARLEDIQEDKVDDIMDELVAIVKGE